MSKISTWSKTAANNNSVSPDGWPEGMDPSGVNNSAREMMAQIRTERENSQWFDFGLTPTYINATSFSLAGDQTTEYHVGRRVRLLDASTLYATILASAYTTITTITLTMDSGSLSGSLSSVELGILSESDDSIPDKVVQKSKTQTLTKKTLVVSSNTVTTAASGNLTSTELNAALAELQTDIDGRAAAEATGSFTPRILDQASNEGTYAEQVGTYTKIGDIVHIQGFVKLATKGTLSAANIISLYPLPYTADTTVNNRASLQIGAAAALSITAGQSISGVVLPNTQQADLVKWSATTGTESLLVSDIGSSFEFTFSATYKV